MAATVPSLLLAAVASASSCAAPRPAAASLVDCSGGFGSNITAAWCAARGCCFDGDPKTPAGQRCTYEAAGSPVHTVHVINSNHFDAGYADLTAAVVNMYFDEYFPRATQVGKEYGRPLLWMTQSLLVSLFLDCPPGMGLHCPNASALASFNASVRAGHITWHAFPHNSELALGSLPFGVRLTHDLDARFGLPPKQTLSTRDVPGMTRAAIPLLHRAGVTAVSEGMNGRVSTAPPSHPP